MTRTPAIRLCSIAAALLALCLLACPPAGAYPSRATVEARFTRYRLEPLGQAVVTQLVDRCGTFGSEACLEALRRWEKERRMHPLVRAAVEHYLALQLRQHGELQAAGQAAAGIGTLSSWTYVDPRGETVTAAADPVSGIVSSGDWVELTPGQERVFTAELESLRDGEVAVRLAAEGLVEVCLGETCETVEPAENLVFDHFVLLFAFRAGTRKLALRFSPEEESVRFAARVTLPDGVVPALRPGPGGTVQVTLPRGGSRVFVPSLLTAAGGGLSDQADRAERALLLCALLDRAGRGGRERIDETVAGVEPSTREEWLEMGECLSSRPARLEHLRRMQERFPADPEVRLAEAAYRASIGASFDAWLALSTMCGDAGYRCLPQAAQPAAALLRRRVSRAMGLPFLSAAIVSEVYADPALRTPDVVSAWGEVLMEQERYAEAAALFAARVEAWPGDRQAVGSLQYTLERCGRVAEALPAMRRVAGLYPTSLYLAVSLARLEEIAGDMQAACRGFAGVEAQGRRSPYALREAGDFHFRQGRSREALRLWKAAALLRPHDTRLKELVAAVGQEAADAGIELPDNDTVRRLSAETPVVEGTRYTGVLDRTRVELLPNGASSLARVQVVRVDEAEPGAEYTVDFLYDTFLESASVLRAVRLTADGRVLPASQTGEVSAGGGDYNLFYDLMHGYVRFEGVCPGDLLVAAYRVETAASGLGVPFAGVAWLQESFPKYATAVEVVTPAAVHLHSSVGEGGGKLYYEQTERELGDRLVTSFRFSALPARKQEPYSPGQYERIAYVHYSSVESVEEFGRWYAGVVYRETGVSAAMRELVARVKGEAADRLDVVRRLTQYVSDEVRYVGLELGVHGLKPYAPRDVFARQFGDCKDKSLLLVTLLAEAGIEARLVAVATATLGTPATPPVSQALFNHAIVYLPEWDLYVDPTARFLSLASLPWQDQGVPAVIVDPQVPRLVTLPERPWSENVAEVALGIGGEESRRVAGTLRFTGQLAWQVRERMEDQGGWRNYVESWAASALAGVRVEATSEVVTPGDVPVVEVTFEGTWLAADGVSYRLCGGVVTDLGALSLASRDLPFVAAFPYEERCRVDFDRGVRLRMAVNTSRDEEEAGYGVDTREQEGGVAAAISFRQKSRRVAVERYDAFRSLLLEFAREVNWLEVQLEPSS